MTIDHKRIIGALRLRNAMRMWRISCNSTLIAGLDIVLLPDTSCKDNGQDYLGVNVTQVWHTDCGGWQMSCD